MLWLSLRTGFGNTAFVAALALLPLIALADAQTRNDRGRTETVAATVAPDGHAVHAPDAVLLARGVD